MLRACCYCKGTGSVGDIYDCPGYSLGFLFRTTGHFPISFLYLFSIITKITTRDTTFLNRTFFILKIQESFIKETESIFRTHKCTRLLM